MSRFKKNQKPPVSKWVVVLLVMAVIYLLLQPLANRQFGWNLPALDSLLPDRPGESADNSEPEPDLELAGSKESTKVPGADKPKPQSQATKPSPPKSQTPPISPAESDSKAQPPLPDVDLTSQRPRAPPKDRDEDMAAEPLLHGVLRPLGRDVYVSPAGLRYTPGSADGHRLEHLARHLEDQPNRSGRHGVFSGDMEQVLKRIDLGYTRAKQRGPMTSMRVEEERTVFEVTFEEPIGYVGGREGARLRRPATNKLRLVTEQDRVITAFPF
jgi:hypothetical protein